MNLQKQIYNPFILLALISFTSVSCNPAGENSPLGEMFRSDFVNAETFKSDLKNTFTPLNTSDSAFQSQLLKDTSGLLNMQYAYQLADYAPLWIDRSGVKPEAASAVEGLKTLREDGLDTGKYHIDALAVRLEQVKAAKSCPLDSLMDLDKSLTRTWLLAARDLLLGDKEIRKGDSLWFAKNDTLFNGAVLLIEALKNGKPVPSLDSFRPNSRLYVQMKKALSGWQALEKDNAYLSDKRNLSVLSDSALGGLLRKELAITGAAESGADAGLPQLLSTYQYYHQLKVTGALDSATRASLALMPEDYLFRLRMNMDRVRALPRDIETEHLWVTIPLMEVDYIKNDEVRFHGKVVVGKVSRQTPTLWANMTNVVFNPPWGVPPTILRNDVGPGVSRSGPAYLGRKGLRAYDSKGRDVTAAVTGANYKSFSYRQPPGAGNSLGEVKFNLPNPWDIYLHDTPHRDNFGSSYRALSSGCVRVQNPKVLAETILDSDKYTADRIDTIISTRRTQTQKLDRRLPVYIIYATIAPDSTGTGLRYLNDLYRRDERMKKRLYNRS